jgi:hypothetical protein
MKSFHALVLIAAFTGLFSATSQASIGNCGSTTYNANPPSVTNPNGLGDFSPTVGCEQTNLIFNNIFRLSDFPSQTNTFTFSGASPTGDIDLNASQSPIPAFTDPKGSGELDASVMFQVTVDQSAAGFLPPAGLEWAFSSFAFPVPAVTVPFNAPGASVHIVTLLCLNNGNADSGNAESCGGSNVFGEIDYQVEGATNAAPVVTIQICPITGAACFDSSSPTLGLADFPAAPVTSINFAYSIDLVSTSTAAVSVAPGAFIFDEDTVTPEPTTFGLFGGGLALIGVLRKRYRF